MGSYQLLPPASPAAPHTNHRRPYYSKRFIKIAVVVFVSFAIVIILGYVYLFGLPLKLHFGQPGKDVERLPPLYTRFHNYELSLSQHQLDTGSQSSPNGKYFWIANHARRSGWGNIMQELLLNHYVAYRAGRSFVFSNYTWNDDGSLYSSFNNKPIPSQIPYTALIQGPTVGAPMRADPAAPLAVMKDFWDKVCPNPTVIRNDDVIASLGRTTTAQLMIDKWVGLLTSTEEACIEVAPDSWQLFDIFIFGDPNRLLDAWPSFSASPILTEFGWSPLIELAFDENRELILPSSTPSPLLSSTPFTHTNAQRYPTIPGLLVLHARRGDFEAHCRNLADWDSGYTGYNAFGSLPDRFEKPRGVTPEEKREIYRRHCYPTIEEIVRRAEEVRKSEAGRGLRGVYIMTNGPVAWVSALKAAFDASGKWAHVASSRDLVLNQEQKYVQQAVDMLIGQRAQVFIGNGFSSLSGQVVMLRMANGISPETNRHWQPVQSSSS